MVQENDKNTLYGYIVWFISTLFVIYSFSLNAAGAVFAETIKTDLQATNVGVSCMAGAFILGFACMQIPAGYLLDRYNSRFLISTAVLLVTLGNIAISFSHSVVGFSLANFIQGVGSSFAFLAASLLISQWFSATMFPILIGLIESLATVFAGVMHYFFVVELTTHHWHEIYQYLALCGIVLFILTLLLVKSPPGYQFAPPTSLKQAWLKVNSNYQIWLCAFAAATSFGVLLAYADFWYVRVQEYYAVQDVDTAIIGGMFFFGIALGAPILGWLSNKVESRKMVLHLALVLGNMMLLLALYLPHFSLNSFLPIKIVSFSTGFFLSGSMLFYTVVSEMSVKRTRGLALSIINTVVFLFNALMLLIPYLAITKVSFQFFTYLWVLPFCVMVALGLLYFIRETYAENYSS